MTAAQNTNDDDLMDMASDFAYTDLQVNDPLSINGRPHTVLNIVHDVDTGLDAFTIQNDTTKEITVAFQGSNGGTDWSNNAVLISTLTPEQFKAAEDYVARQGDVDYVCGNSLGGGLAAYVGAKNPNIKAVTVNPAPVPQEVANANAPNVRNYIVDNDMLHQLVVTGGLDSRIIGETRTVSGSYINDVFGPNHVGSERHHGTYDASMAVPFSLFHDDQVVSAGTYGKRVDITLANLLLVAVGLQRQQADMTSVRKEKLTSTDKELKEHRMRLPVLERQAHAAIINGFDSAYDELVRRRIDAAQVCLDQFRTVVRSMHAPNVVAFFWNALADVLLGGLDRALEGLEVLGSFAARGVAEGACLVYSANFTEVSKAITNGLIQQVQIVKVNFDTVDAKWSAFTDITVGVAEQVLTMDEDMAAAIASRTCPSNAVSPANVEWPNGRLEKLDEQFSQSLAQTVIELRTEAGSAILTGIATRLGIELAAPSLVLKSVDDTVQLVEDTLVGATAGLAVAVRSIEDNIITRTLDIDDDIRRFREQLVDLAVDYKLNSDTVQEVIRAVRRALGELPSLMLSVQPQIESLIFSDEQIQAVYDSLSMCRNLTDRSELAFGEARFQLEDHSASAIDALSHRADQIEGYLSTIGDQLSEMIS